MPAPEVYTYYLNLCVLRDMAKTQDIRQGQINHAFRLISSKHTLRAISGLLKYVIHFDPWHQPLDRRSLLLDIPRQASINTNRPM
jgi:hypothetical protein